MNPYTIRSIHFVEKLRLKDLREKFTRSAIEFSNYEMVIKYAEDSYLFVYNYGSLVFFNVSDELQEKELSSINEYKVPSDVPRSTDTFYFELEAGPPKVYFDRIVAPELTYPMIRIACMLLAESTALEYYEVLIENLMLSTNVISRKLQTDGQMLQRSKELIKFIGMCLSTKQEIISNLYIVDSPDEIWENSELNKVHQELKAMLEVDTRYRALDYKIQIVQEGVEIIVDLAKNRQATRLEIIIIVLIALEIGLSLVQMTR